MAPADVVVVPDAPSIAGLVFRTFRGPSDFAAMAAVHEAARERDALDPDSARDYLPSTEDLAREHAQDTSGSPDLLMVEVDGALVGYARLLWWTEADGTRVYLHLGWLRPAWRGRGIGSAMLRWSQARLRSLALLHPTDGRAVFATNVASTEREADALIRGAGYTAVRRLSDMVLADVRQLPDAALPAGLQRRPVTPADYPAIYAAFKDAWQGLWGSTPADEADYRAFLRANVEVPGADPSLWRVAWAGDTVAGLVLCRTRKDVGMVAEVAVRRAWQRRGLASALMVDGLRTLRDRGMRQARLYTDALDGQGARTLYERLGFIEAKQHILYRKPMAVDGMSARTVSPPSG